MTAEGAIEFEALETQAASLMRLFVEAGYERVAPAFIQPASLFLDRIGEALRARTYVFTDPDGEELCLRPDLTIPVCRIFLERPNSRAITKFCYNGPAFRVQEGRPDPLRPREFRQAGIEYFGLRSAEADLEVLKLTIEAVRKGGLRNFTIKLGHIGIFTALLNALDMPARWRQRLARSFWRPAVFASELERLSRPKKHRSSFLPSDILTCEELLNDLETRSVPFIGLRRPSEIVKRLKEKAADAEELPLSSATVGIIQDYLRITRRMPDAVDSIETLAGKAKLDISAAVAEARTLFEGLLPHAGSALLVFAADFGRHFEYYSGMVFQIEIEGAGIPGQIAGGGRYDGLVKAMSQGRRDVPAVGAAIHTERLLAAAAGKL
ncbi:MAG TPA: ATP phosphoribosyltransferase regulatory subunit [Hyphomicrobiales bacterium]|nr:ATP phosphoribosyltransferase regulatory subunit [Hyphomicrobiales bacterium]